MDINELKKLIKNSTAVLVLDNGEPSFVILGYKMYKDVIGGKEGEEKEISINSVPANAGNMNGRSFHDKETEILDRLNKEILALRNQIEMEEKGINSSSID